MMKKRHVVTTTQIAYSFIVMVAVFVATQFHVTSSDNMDFARHMIRIQYINNSNMSLYQFLFGGGDSFTTNISLKYCYVFNFIMYFAAKCLKNYYIIVWLFVLIDYSIIAYIGIDWWKGQKRRNFAMGLFEMLVCFSLLPYVHAVSGLRTAMASCIMALALYKYLYKGERFLRLVIITILAALFHPGIILAIPFAILAKKVDRKLGLIITIVAGFLVSVVAQVLVHSSNSFLYAIALKYLQYTEGGYRGTRFCYYGVIIICILVIIQYIILHLTNGTSIKNNSTSDERTSIFDFIVYYMIYTLCNIGDYELVMRPGYLLGAFAPIITGMIFSKRYAFKNAHTISWMINIMLFAVMAYVSVMYVYYYGKFFV